jgi:hypothetical protein
MIRRTAAEVVTELHGFAISTSASPRRWVLATLVIAGLSAAGCGRSSGLENAPASCTDGSPVARVSSFKAALRSAPEPVRLSDGTSIADCLSHDADSGDIQNVGSMLLTITQNLVDAPASKATLVQLGYISGAVHLGASKAQGVDAEIERRIQQELDTVDRADPAFKQGERAGRANG